MKMCTETVYDKMHNAHPRLVANISMKALDAIQSSPPDIQLTAVGALLLILSRRLGIAPSTVLNCVDNIMRTSRRYDDATFKGIYAYFDNEI